MKLYSFLAIVVSLVASTALAQTTRTWNGSANNDWYNASNWTPTGVPATNDTVNFSSGTINLTAPVTIAGQFNWFGGTLLGSPLTIATNGTLTLGPNTMYLQMPLTNAGTVNWTGGTFYVMNDGTANYKAVVENLAGALWDARGDQTLSSYFGGSSAWFHNSGTLRKSAGTGSTSLTVVLYNAGTVLAQTGIISIQNGSVIESNFTASSGAGINFAGGTFTYSSVPTLTGPGAIQFTGGALTLINDVIPNLQLTGGTVTLGASFQGGTVTNLVLSGSALAGDHVVSGTFNWVNGTLNGAMRINSGAYVNWASGTALGPISVANGASLVLGGSGTKYLQNVMTNAGTVTWTNGTLYVMNNGTPTYSGGVENLAGGLWDAQCDASLASYFGGVAAYFRNQGILRKSALSGSTSVSVVLSNSAAVLAQQGTLDFQNGRTIEGSFTASAGAAIHFSGGSFTYITPPTLTGPGAIQFTGGSLTLNDDLIPNLQLTGGTLILATNFQGGTITNLTLLGSVLSGDHSVSGLFNWVNGNLTGALRVNPGGFVNWANGTALGPITVVNGGSFVLGGSGTKYLQNVLTNAGTVTWTNGTVYVLNNGTTTYAGGIENLAGGLWDAHCDASLANYFGGTAAYFHNLGTLQKSAAGGTTYLSVTLQNQGSVVVQQGVLNLQNGGTIEGSFSAAAGSAIVLSGGAFSYATPPTLTGPGAIQFTGGSLALLDNTIPNLQLVGGTLTLAPNFQGGTITNLNFGGTLSGNYTVSGTLTLGNGLNGNLSIANGGVLNWNGGSINGINLVSGAGLNWNNGTLLTGLNVVPGSQVNWSGGTANGPINVPTGATLLFGGTGTRYLQNVLTNAGTVTWTNGTIYVLNNGTATYAGGIENLAGGLWDARCDASLATYFGGTSAYFHNLGTLQKSAAGGATYLSVTLQNQGSVVVQQGALNLQNGGTIEGSFSAAGGSAILLSGGAFSYATPPTLTGPGAIQFTGGSLALLDNTIPNLQLVGGTLTLAPNFQGGTITNLNFGGTLSGNYTVSGTLTLGNGLNGNLSISNGGVLNWNGGSINGINLVSGAGLNWNNGTLLTGLNVVPGSQVNWSGGTANGPINVPTGAMLLFGGGGTRYLQNVLTNAGTVTWTNGTIYVLNNGTATYAGGVENLAGGLWDAHCDASLATYFGGTSAYFHNLGTLQKSAAGGTTFLSVTLQNQGSVVVQQGTLNLQNGGTVEGSFSAAAGSAIFLSGGAFSYATPPTLTGPGAIQFTGGSLALLDNTIPNLQLVGGTLTLAPNFQGGTITNLNFGGTLSGNYAVSGTLTLGNGLNGNLSIANGGVLNWNNGTISGTLTVADGGALNWNNGTLTTPLAIVPGAQINWSSGTANSAITVISNASLVLGGNGTRYLQNVLTNFGTVTWTNGAIYVLNNGSATYAGGIENLPGGLWDIRCDQGLYTYFGGSAAYFHNLGTLQKSGTSGSTPVSVIAQNAGLIGIYSGNINFQNSYTQTGAALNFGLSSATQPAAMTVSGNISLDGTLSAAYVNSYLPKVGDNIRLISAGSLTNPFAAINLPAAGNNLAWRVNYATNALNLLVVSNANVTGQITGSVLDNTAAPVGNLTVYAFTTNSGNTLFLSTTTAPNGSYVLNVTNGGWRVGVQGAVTRGYNDPGTKDVIINNANQTANFVLQPYTGQSYSVTVAANPPAGGSASGGGIFLPGSLVNVIATPNTATLPYYFSAWTENGVQQSTANPYVFTAQRNRQLVANFALPVFTIAASNNPPAGGTVSGAGSYVYASTSVLTAQPNFGYNFGSWTENGTVVGTSPTLSTTVYSNRTFVANYTEANTNHFVTTATQPPGLGSVSGAGVYTNGQSTTFAAPPVIVSGQFDYYFQRFVLTNTVVSTTNNYVKTFSTVDPTNLQYVAVYTSLGIMPQVTNVTANFPNPAPATTNFQLAFRFDRPMDTNFLPLVILTNTGSGSVQPVVPAGGRWSSVVQNNDTFSAPAITFSAGMDGQVQVLISGARDPLGVTVPQTNVYSVVVDATPPVLSGIASAPSVLTAFITWNSDEAASSMVEYGTTTSYGSSSGWYGQLVNAHGLTLNGLNPLTTYHYRAHSRDLAGNEAFSGDNTFTTYAAPDLEVANLSVTGSLTSGGALQISWSDTNSGSGATFSYWYDQVIVTNATTGQTLLNSTVFYDPSAGGNLASGGARNRQFSFTLPNGPSGAGNLQAIVIVNAYRNQYEANGSGNAQANNTQSLPFTSTLSAYPDLQVANLAVTNASVQSGARLGLVWSDTNSGNSSVTAAYSDRLLVVNQTTAQTLLDTVINNNAASIPPGGAVQHQYQFTLPDGQAGAGSLRVTVFADVYSQVFEYNSGGTAESNNTNSIAVNSVLAPYPDLVATNILVPVTAKAGQSVPIVWTDLNQGAGPATNTWYDQVFFTETNTIGGGQLLGTFQFTNPLAAGASMNVTQAVTLPQFVQGNRWIVVKANASASFYELNTTNNSGVSTQAVAITSTLLLSLSRTTVSEAEGTNSLLGTITRNGDISGALAVQLATATGTNLYVPAALTIPAGQSAVNFLCGPIDNFISGNPVSETITATAPGFPPATRSLTILQDDPATLALNLTATSVNEDAGTEALKASVARNANFGSPLTVTLVSDNPGALTAPVTVTIPAGQASVSFGLTPVPLAGLNDARHANVSASAPGFSSVSTTVTILDVNTVKLTLNLLAAAVNKGSGSSGDVGTVRMVSALPDPQNVRLTVQGSSLVTVPSTVTIPAGATSVNFNIGVANDNLSTGTQTATILAQPLTPGWLTLTNGQASAVLQILDINGPSLSLRAANSTISKGSNTLVTVTRNTLPTNAVAVALSATPSGIVSLPASVNIPLNQSSATFTVTGILDGRQTGPEAVTLNASATGYNAAAAPLTVSDIYLPDLVPSSVSAVTNAVTSTQTTVTWVVANNGLGATTNQVWRDYVYLASDGAGQNVQLVALVTNKAPLSIGASYTNQATFYFPVVPANYWVMVVADGGNVVTELNKQNNSVVSSLPVAVNPVYRAAITNVTPAIAPSGTPILLSGRTYDPVTSQAKPNQFATVRIIVNGARRVFTVLSDNNGNFSYTFQPLANEAGDYTVGADYPYLLQDPVQGTFALLGMQALPASLNATILPNVAYTGQLVLSNLANHDLTGLSITFPDLQGTLSAQFNITNTTLPGSGSETVGFTFQSSVTRNAQIRFNASVTSSEGAQLTLPVAVNVVPLVPQLVANPGYLSSGMLVGDQTLVSFDVLNNGGASSGDLTLALPTNLTWITLSSPAIIPSIPAGGKATVTLLLTPPENLPLTLYTGNLALFNANAGLNIQFQFRAVSTATGDLRVRATDDYTYYVAGGPGVTNATIVVRDPFTSAIIAQTNSDAQGIAYFAALPAGPYTIDGSAPKHNQFRGSATVGAGTVADLEAFMPRQLVTYQWSVVPTEVQDNYKIVLESVFETQVPVPNVVVEEPRVMLIVAPGVASQFTIKLSNHGLIAANGVKINVPDDPKYLITPVTTEVGIIPAQSSVEVPVTVQLRSAPAPGIRNPASMVESEDGGCSLSDLNACLPDIPLGVTYYYVCGPNNVLQQRSIDLSVICTAKDVKDCLDGLKETATSSENLISLGCNALKALIACAGVKLSPCQAAAVSTACGAAVGFLEGGPAGAAAGGASAGASDILQCICDLLKNISLPSFPSSGGGGGGFGFGFGGGGGGGWAASGGGIGTGSSVGNCSSSLAGGFASATTVPSFLGNLKAPKRTGAAQGVCAKVRIRIEQSVTLTRSAFRGTLELDNGGDTSLTGITVNLDFRDGTNGAAASKFVIEGPVVSGMGAVDGTGTLAGGGSGSAVYTFIPTLDAAPMAPATYQIGGTLSYVDNGETVVVPLLSAPITVYPEARLDLVYFQQRDVYADDPFTSQTEPSEPFYLGLLVKNNGAGAAHNFQITSGQPKIVDNRKGLLIDFSIIGTQVGSQAISPSLTANLGDIQPGGAKEVNWQMISSLQGKFISFNASFEHVNDLGSTNTSLINSVEIHELIHPVLANRTGDDNVLDYLVNDVPDPDNLPDLLYLSDGSVAQVNVVTNGTFDGQIGPGRLQVHLQAAAGTGWNYFQLPDPGTGFILQQVVRSDGKVLALTNNAWVTDRSFPSSSTGAVYENLLHLFDWAGTGSYTLSYRSTNTTPPAIASLGPVTPYNQSGALSAVALVFSEPIDTNTFSYANLSLTRNGGANLINSGSGVSLVWLSNATYSISGLAPLTALDGNYQLTLSGSGIYDLWGNNAGNVSTSVQWVKGNAPPVVQSISPVLPNPRNTPVTAVTVNFSKAINAATFNNQVLSLTLNGGPNLITGDVTISSQSPTSFNINGLGALTGAQGDYVLTVNAAALQDTLGTAGQGSASVAWSVITTGPGIVALEPVTTNPRNIVVQKLDVTFSGPIDPSTFDYHDMSLTRDGGPNLITSDVTVTRVNPTTYRVGNISWVQGYAGLYSFTLNAAGIQDLAGNSGSGSTNETWQIILAVPSSPTNLFVTPDTGISSIDGLTATNRVTLFGNVGASNLTVRINDTTTGTDLGTAVVNGTNFSAGLTFTATGAHRLELSAVDIAGNVSPFSFFNLFVDVTPPTALIQQVASPLYSPVTNLEVTFSEAINTSTLSAGNFVIQFNGSNAVTPALSLVSGTTYRLSNLAAYTAPLGTYQVTLNLSGIQDLAGNRSTNVLTMSWVHATTNVPPAIDPIPSVLTPPDRAIALQVKASDFNGDRLTYTLAPGAAPGATMDPLTGIFRWLPGRNFSDTTNSFTVIVTDNGSPAMSTNQTFTVQVLDYLEVSLGSTNVQAGDSASLPVYIASNAGVTNVNLTLGVPGNILTNWTLTPLAPQIGSATLQDQTTNLLVALRMTAGQMLQGTQLVARLNFTASPNHGSSFVTLPFSAISGLKPTGAPYLNYVPRAGSVAVVEGQPFLLGVLSNNVSRVLLLYGRVGNNYQVQSTTNLAVPNNWQPFFNYTQTNGIITVPLSGTNPAVFYRMQQQ